MQMGKRSRRQERGKLIIQKMAPRLPGGSEQGRAPGARVELCQAGAWQTRGHVGAASLGSSLPNCAAFLWEVGSESGSRE